MNDAFFKRLKRLHRADLKPKYICIDESGTITNGVANPGDVIGGGALFFLDVELPSKMALMISSLPKPEFAKSMYELSSLITKFARVASFTRPDGSNLDWAVQFETDRDFQIGLKYFMQRQQEYAIYLAYAPNQEKQP